MFRRIAIGAGWTLYICAVAILIASLMFVIAVKAINP